MERNEESPQMQRPAPGRRIFKSDGPAPRPAPLPSDERNEAGGAPEEDFAVQAVPGDVFDQLEAVAKAAGGEFEEPEEYRGSVARTMFDTAQSRNNTLTVVLPSGKIQHLPIQSLVRIRSRGDGRSYLGAVVEGPFAEPDGLRGDSPIVVTVTVKGSIFMPQYHGRVQVEILGEETEAGLVPPRFRPLPNSPVFPLSSTETAAILNVAPEGPAVTLGLAVGHEELRVNIPAHAKSVLPRHTAVLGTTGGGKSTTLSGMVGSFQRADLATVLIDTEGEYTMIDQPTEDERMRALLSRRGIPTEGISKTVIYHLVGKETSNPEHPRRHPFCLRFSRLSPYVISEIREFSPAQHERYFEAYDITKRVLADLGIFPSRERRDADEQRLFELDEQEEGYPDMKLEHVCDIVQACALLAKKEEERIAFSSPDFVSRREEVMNAVHAAKGNLSGNWQSWRALQGNLGRLKRLGIFDSQERRVTPLNYRALTTPGQVSLIDLSGTDSPQTWNLVIAELLRGILEQQDENYAAVERREDTRRRTVIVIEEAHEFLSAERIQQMPILFQQVARIARRGRKRWLGLLFVTQLPQHLPDEVLGLVNNYILHKITDAGVISRLRKTVGGLDESQWGQLPNLAPGQAIVSMTSLTRPLLVAIDPSPCKLRMADAD